ncbi:peptide deformylase [Clostridium fungisolvens]|uniref:Peptide deformylase n=1 Tax=Clostridium fungisolvens TaxID=1604897 RepID=A0A6V8SG20_9CLOT|nr:peptide deformylase [Clostridium fungisolvens]GFP76164.1 Peptide deformylase [Clostridium fungisolvens]
MAVKEIFLLGNEKLYNVSEEIKQEELVEVEEVVKDLHDTLMNFRKEYGAGRAIAAPQIGYFKRLIYMNIDKEVVLINPKLEYVDDEMITVWDDCMCFPELLVKVKRFKRCVVYYKDLAWKDNLIELEGDISELIQHEYDHLDGILAVQKAIDDRSFSIKTKIIKNT